MKYENQVLHKNVFHDITITVCNPTVDIQKSLSLSDFKVLILKLHSGAANSIFLSHTDESSKDETRVCGCNIGLLVESQL